MGPLRCPETSVNNYHTTPRNIPEECISDFQFLFFALKFCCYFRYCSSKTIIILLYVMRLRLYRFYLNIYKTDANESKLLFTKSFFCDSWLSIYKNNFFVMSIDLPVCPRPYFTFSFKSRVRKVRVFQRVREM